MAFFLGGSPFFSQGLMRNSLFCVLAICLVASFRTLSNDYPESFGLSFGRLTPTFCHVLPLLHIQLSASFLYSFC